MGDARTKLDILYQDVLGDVSDLVSRIERLDDQFPALAEQINNAAERLESASTAIQERLAKLATMEASKAVSQVRQELIDERMRQEGELQKAVNAHIGSIADSANKAVTPAADKLLNVALDAIREREVLVKEKEERPVLLHRLAAPLMYVAIGAVVGTATAWALNSVAPAVPQPVQHQQQR